MSSDQHILNLVLPNIVVFLAGHLDHVYQLGLLHAGNCVQCGHYADELLLIDGFLDAHYPWLIWCWEHSRTIHRLHFRGTGLCNSWTHYCCLYPMVDDEKVTRA